MPLPALSIILVSYDMPREIPRTLRSLSPSIQAGVSGEDYEVIVVDNGSRRGVDPGECRWPGQNLSFENLPPGDPSPCRAINRGLELARGEVCGVMIDGARMASPGLIAGVLRARRLHHRPVISTLGFHLGPAHQSLAHLHGYDQREEDRMLEAADWTADGYRLFEISVFAGACFQGWFAPMTESNALFMTAAMWAELGGFDPRFRQPGGGLVNLDTYQRACALPDSQLITLLGEGTFHQIHGGIASNARVLPWDEFHAEYMAIRGKAFMAPTTLPLLIGTVNRHILPTVVRSVAQPRLPFIQKVHSRLKATVVGDIWRLAKGVVRRRGTARV